MYGDFFILSEVEKIRKKITLERNVNKTFDEGYDEFILYCKARNLSPATITHYDNSVAIWYKFIDHKTPIREITQETLNNFILFCKTKMNQNDVTVRTNVRSMRAILYYFMKLEYMEEFKVQELKVTKEPIETYTDAELKILLEKPNLKKCSFGVYRTYVIINFLLATGCRASTLINLKISDLDFENDLIYYNHTKNRKGQIVPMSYSLKQVLIEYLTYRQGQAEDYLFSTVYNNKMNVNTLNHAVADYNKKRGVIKTGIHRFRHTFAKKWILNNGDVFRLQKMLGHSDMTVVKNYVEMFSDDLKKDFNEFNPLEGLIEKPKKSIKMK